MKKIIVVSCLAGISMLSVAFAGDSNMDGNLKWEMKSANAESSVYLEKFSGTCVSGENWRWGAEGTCPQTKVSKILVSFKKQPVFIPVSAFADLGNPRKAEIAQIKEGFAIEIIGGDAATSYKAVLMFKDGFLVSKKVVSGEFPDVAWEETRYGWNTQNK